MLGVKERDQLALFVAGSLRDLLPEGQVFARVDGVLVLSWLSREVAGLYCPYNGRPGIDPEGEAYGDEDPGDHRSAERAAVAVPLFGGKRPTGAFSVPSNPYSPDLNPSKWPSQSSRLLSDEPLHGHTTTSGARSVTSAISSLTRGTSDQCVRLRRDGGLIAFSGRRWRSGSGFCRFGLAGEAVWWISDGLRLMP